jgi:hypothetical protein
VPLRTDSRQPDGLFDFQLAKYPLEPGLDPLGVALSTFDARETPLLSCIAGEHERRVLRLHLQSEERSGKPCTLNGSSRLDAISERSGRALGQQYEVGAAEEARDEVECEAWQPFVRWSRSQLTIAWRIVASSSRLAPSDASGMRSTLVVAFHWITARWTA